MKTFSFAFELKIEIRLAQWCKNSVLFMNKIVKRHFIRFQRSGQLKPDGFVWTKMLNYSIKVNSYSWSSSAFINNPLSPDVNIHVLVNDLHTFLLVLVGRIWLNIKSFLFLVIIHLIPITCLSDQVVILWGEIKCLSLLEYKENNSFTSRKTIWGST